MKNKYDKKHMAFGNAFAIADPLVVAVIDMLNININNILKDDNVLKQFLERYVLWISETNNNRVLGLENYPHACFANGTTEAFEKFYAKHHKRRFRFYKGEYVYHRLNCRNNGYDWEWLDDIPLDRNDVVMISLPFSDTGNTPKDLELILDRCDKLKIPVLIDCAYLGVCSDIDFNFDRECITDITFSLSKSLYCAHARIGMRLTKEDDDDPLFVTNKAGYINKIAAHIGLQLINRFSPDYIYDTYRARQEEYCKILGVEPSNCVLFGIGDNRWVEYNRDRETNRLSLHKYLASNLTNEITEIANEKRQNT
ncbi:MAG: aminotransferase class I/II-fold pyridoxal phosphate-dependent enzyme [Methylophagaceae bacterium]